MGSGMGKKIKIRRRAYKQYFGLKSLIFFDADPGSGIFLTLDPRPGMEKIPIRDKHPGSATLHFSKTGPNLAQPPYSMSKNQRTVKFLDGPRSCERRTNKSTDTLTFDIKDVNYILDF
jgi:hypothetical protein